MGRARAAPPFGRFVGGAGRPDGQEFHGERQDNRTQDQSSPVLPGGTNWTPVSAPVFTNAGWSTLNTNASAGRQLYFRLHRP